MKAYEWSKRSDLQVRRSVLDTTYGAIDRVAVTGIRFAINMQL
jgi:hypothetical protein